MSELDRRIAVEVMGEPRPSTAQVSPSLQSRKGYSPGGGWSTTHSGIWLPLPFSSDIEQALRAVDKYLIDSPYYISSTEGKKWRLNLFMQYMPDGEEHHFKARLHTKEAYGPTLPEAICNLLLALIENDKND